MPLLFFLFLFHLPLTLYGTTIKNSQSAFSSFITQFWKKIENFITEKEKKPSEEKEEGLLPKNFTPFSGISEKAKKKFEKKYQQLRTYFHNAPLSSRDALYDSIAAIEKEYNTKIAAIRQAFIRNDPEAIAPMFFQKYPTRESLLNALSHLKERYEASSFDYPFDDNTYTTVLLAIKQLTEIVPFIEAASEIKEKLYFYHFFGNYSSQSLTHYSNDIIAVFWGIFVLPTIDEIVITYGLDERERQLIENKLLYLPAVRAIQKKTMDTTALTKIIFNNAMVQTKSYGGTLALIQEVLSGPIHGKMAQRVINKKIFFMTLLAKEEGRRNALYHAMARAIALEKEMSEEQYSVVTSYLSSFVPGELFHGVNAPTYLYILGSIFQQYRLSLFQMCALAYQKGLRSLYHQESTNTKEYSIAAKVLFGPFLRYFGTEGDKKSIDEIYTLRDLKQCSPSTSFIGKSLIPFMHISLIAVPEIIVGWSTLKGLYQSYTSLKNMITYFSLLKQFIKVCKEICGILQQFYQEEQLPLGIMPFDFYDIYKMFYEKKSYKPCIKKLESWGEGMLGKLRYLSSIFVPGILAKFYFQELNNTSLEEELHHFIGLVDVFFSKMFLVATEPTQYTFPSIIAEDEAAPFIEGKGIWYFNTAGTPIANDMTLGREPGQKNMLLISPIGAGKTVFLSGITNNLLLAHCGIVCAKKLTFTYFTSLYERIKPEYETGKGSSGGLEELEGLIKIGEYLKEEKRLGTYTLSIFDEIFQRTKHTNVIKNVERTLKDILESTTNIAIVTTHLTEVAPFIAHNYSTTLWYFKVNENSDGTFTPTYQLCADDKENWWVNNDESSLEKQARYELYQEHKQREKLLFRRKGAIAVNRKRTIQ